jgi:predicted  nucleic acid-binding Zn-ribbon protein
LQEIDLKLDKVKEERGDLPEIVKELEDRLSNNKHKLESQKEKIKQLKVETSSLESELDTLKAKLKKYEDQLYQVKTNKEYDAISNETETVKAKISEYEDKIIRNAEMTESLEKSNELLVSELANLDKEYEENNTLLQEKINASSEEEHLLIHEREIVEKKLSQHQISSYRRIRDAKKGVAVASCNGGVCSGCFSFIPPQRVVEIKSMKQLHQCESCGRILVWDRNLEE